MNHKKTSPQNSGKVGEGGKGVAEGGEKKIPTPNKKTGGEKKKYFFWYVREEKMFVVTKINAFPPPPPAPRLVCVCQKKNICVSNFCLLKNEKKVYGLFARKDIPKGFIIDEYLGVINRHEDACKGFFTNTKKKKKKLTQK